MEGCGKATACPAFDLLGYEVSTARLAHLELMLYFHSGTSEIKDFTLMSQLRIQAAKCLEKSQD